MLLVKWALLDGEGTNGTWNSSIGATEVEAGLAMIFGLGWHPFQSGYRFEVLMEFSMSQEVIGLTSMLRFGKASCKQVGSKPEREDCRLNRLGVMCLGVTLVRCV